MMRAATRCRYVAVTLLIAWWAPIDTSTARQHAPVTCPLEIVGTWRLSTSAEAPPSLLSFSPDGWVNVLGNSGEHRPRDFDIIDQVRYGLVPRRGPERLEFRTRRGNDVFPPGTSSWEITAHSDESFATRRVDSEAGEQSLWSRVQTHRYFVTFAARGGAALDGTKTRDAAAFVMWTMLDGRKTELEALGIAARDAGMHFGRIPNELAKAFVTQSNRGDDVMMRLELNEAEYHRTRHVFEAWDALASRDLLARNDPYDQAMEFLEATIQSVNQCSMRIQPADASTAPTVDGNKKENSQRRPWELIRTMRKINDRRHLQDKVFPFRWMPPPVT